MPEELALEWKQQVLAVVSEEIGNAHVTTQEAKALCESRIFKESIRSAINKVLGRKS